MVLMEANAKCSQTRAEIASTSKRLIMLPDTKYQERDGLSTIVLNGIDCACIGQTPGRHAHRSNESAISSGQ
eukprot:712006-Amphidinium_carterae.1